MSDPQEINGPASRVKLERLWASLLDALQTAMAASKAPSSELMGIVRIFVRDNGVKPSPDQVSQLQALHTQLTSRLTEVMSKKETPSATNMETVRRLLHDSGISKDTDLRIGLDQLSDLSVPFH
jgi:hypothetical protein